MNTEKSPNKGGDFSSKMGPSDIESLERSRIIEEIFKKYHKKLIDWCEYKLIKKNLGSHIVNYSEDIVANVYQNLLTAKNPIDLTRSEPEILAYLNIALDHQVGNYIRKMTEKKRMPAGGLVSLEDEEVLGEKDEEELALRLKEHFIQPTNTNEKEEDLYEKIEEAILMLESKDKQKADVIKKRYREGKTQEEVAKDLGVTRGRISKIQQEALEKILKFLKYRIKD